MFCFRDIRITGFSQYKLLLLLICLLRDVKNKKFINERKSYKPRPGGTVGMLQKRAMFTNIITQGRPMMWLSGIRSLRA